MAKITQEEQDELDWLVLKKKMTDGYQNFEQEKGVDKFVRKFKESPLVPIGCVATSTALVMGLAAMKRGDSKMSNLMMRFRVGAQGFTVIAIITGLVFTAYQN